MSSPFDLVNGTGFKKLNVFGGTLFNGAKALCADGKIRSVWTAKQADTYFSVPAAVRIKGKRYTGYVTQDDGNLTQGIPEGGALIFRPHIGQDCETLKWKGK